MNICIVSPHIDDAILSCGIRIQREIAAGNTVFILDIFSAGTNGENRQKEEQRAARIIGAEPHFLNELDAPDRDSRYSSVKELFLGDLRHVPVSFIEKLAGRIADFFKLHNITRAW
ncbi:MAG TPA: PIG-L family deacetylase, partial [Patescibacteria group bacterium]|nr:PIG-L family deacetylase [Patescibacteria group bacterium]